ncbi:conjugal transfer mating-pair stabilization protein TraG [Photobacterium damselae]|uniref:conjugal transfer mating-pair stabilization protein TraG n=1 Tax=Photobacterium damselae TaxID=38293 RepID=UPI003D7CDF04
MATNVMDVYTFTGGKTAWAVFNALATFFNGTSWVDLMFMVGAIAVFITTIQFFFSRDPNQILMYFFSYLLITALLLTPKVTVRIDDSSGIGRTYMVANVPIGVAAPISYATMFMYGMAHAIDIVFRLPNDAAYSKSGMLFGSKVIGLTNKVSIQDSKLKNYWSQYLQNCVRKDITINNKYTWSQFANATDIFEFLRNNHPSPVRRILMDGNFMTCSQALPKLEKKFNEEADKQWPLLSNWANAGRIGQQQGVVKAAVANSYNTFFGINKGASETLRQNLAINATRDGLYDGAASVNASASAFNYARTHSQMQTQSALTTMGLNAMEWLPIIHSALILLLACSSIPVFLMAFIPNMTARVLKGYCGGFFLIALWPMYFSFVNMIMTYQLEAAGANTTNLMKGMSLNYSDPIVALHMKYAAIAGGLMMLVPFIAKASLSGGMAIVGATTQQVTSMLNSNAARAAGAAASGDISYGVVQTDTWQANTANSNKFDTSYSNQSYGALTQRADGSSTTLLPSGGAVYNTQGAVSRTTFDITSGDVQSRALSQGITDAQRAATQASTSYNQTMGSVTDKMLSLTHAASSNQSYGSGTQHTMNSSLQDTLTKIDGVVADEAKSKGISYEDAYKRMVDTYAGFNTTGSANVGGKFGMLGGASLGVSGNAGKKLTVSDSSTDSHRTDRTSRTSSSRQNQFNDAMSAFEQFANSNKTDELRGDNRQAVSSINEGLKDAKQYAESYNANYSREKAYTSALHDTQTGSLALNKNLIPEFQQFLVDSGCDHVEALMVGTSPSINDERDAYVQSFFEQKYAGYRSDLKDSLDESHIGHQAQAMQGSNLQGLYQDQSGKIENEAMKGQIKSTDLDKKTQVEQDKLYSNEDYADKRDTQTHSRQYYQDDLADIKKGRGLK